MPGSFAITINKVSWDLCCTPDLESLWESIGQEDFGADERLPYWAEVWPASVALASWLQENPAKINGGIGLELGCGVGLLSLVVSSLGAYAAGLDYEWPAVALARKNALRNLTDGQQPLFVQSDWRWPAVRRSCLDFIVAGDILYERRFIGPVTAFLHYSLKPGGTAWLAGPDRNTHGLFQEALQALGCSARLVETRVPPATQRQPVKVAIHIWEIRKSF